MTTKEQLMSLAGALTGRVGLRVWSQSFTGGAECEYCGASAHIADNEPRKGERALAQLKHFTSDGPCAVELAQRIVENRGPV